MTQASTFLSAEGITKSYGGVNALNKVSLSFESGEIHALMGENGAGKSTLGKILAGAVQRDAGTICLNGKPLTINNPVDAQRHGIAIIFQEIDLFPNLTVADNLAIRNLAFSETRLINRKRLHAFCRPFLERVGLEVDPGTRLGDLPIGRQQQVAIARALSMNAQVIVFDESTSALSDESVNTLFEVMCALRSEGVTCIYVSHKLDEIFRIADRITVLRDGCMVGTRLTIDTDRKDLIKMMIGHEVPESDRSNRTRTATPLLEVTALTGKVVTDISFHLHEGDILGIAGLVGSGRGDLLHMLYGLRKPRSGSIRVKEKICKLRSPAGARKNSIGLVPRDRKTEGLFMQMSLRKNTTLSSLSRFHRLGVLDRRREANASDEAIRQTRLKAAGPEADVSTLSGGNQQKALLGRWLIVDPGILLLDDPTRGVDVGAKEDIYAIIEKLAESGKGIIMTSSELPELLRCCNRILVLNEGQQMLLEDCHRISQEDILHLTTAGVAT